MIFLLIQRHTYFCTDFVFVNCVLFLKKETATFFIFHKIWIFSWGYWAWPRDYNEGDGPSVSRKSKTLRQLLRFMVKRKLSRRFPNLKWMLAVNKRCFLAMGRRWSGGVEGLGHGEWHTRWLADGPAAGVYIPGKVLPFLVQPLSLTQRTTHSSHVVTWLQSKTFYFIVSIPSSPCKQFHCAIFFKHHSTMDTFSFGAQSSFLIFCLPIFLIALNGYFTLYV